MARYCSVACIIPPVLLERMARNGDAEAADRALRTLSRDATLRAARIHNSLVGTPANATTVLQSIAPGQARRTIFDCAAMEPVTDPRIVRSEGDGPTGDAAADEAYDGLGATYDFYWQQFRRDSIDDQGLSLHGWVHYGHKYDNAMWDGREMVFGDGDTF